MHILTYGKELWTPPIPTTKIKVGGEFRCILRNSMGGIVRDTDWFPNLITNTGLANMHTQTWYSIFHIGTGSSAPAFTDSTLGGWLARDSVALGDTESGTPVAPNYEYWTTKGKRFNAGVGTGLIAELGISWNTGNSGMCIRTLVTPAINKAVDQVLDVYYRFKIFPDLNDTIGVIPINGEDYDYIFRAKDVDTNDYQRTFTGLNWGTDGSYIHCYTDNIGAVTGAPSAPAGGGGSNNAETYNGTFVASGSDTGLGIGWRDTQFRYHLDEANASGGVRSVTVRGPTQISAKGAQCQFDRVSDGAKILKDNTKEMYFTFRFQYAR